MPHTYKQESFSMERGVDMDSVSLNESKLRADVVPGTVAVG